MQQVTDQIKSNRIRLYLLRW